MRRREFIALLAGAGAAWPLAARAQQPVMPVIGFVHTASAAPNAQGVAAFVQGLKDTGYLAGQNIAIEYRWAEGQYGRLPAMVLDLIGRQVKVIVASGGTAPAEAAKVATSTIPIVFVSGDDPVKHGLVASLNRPGGNVTGVVFFNSALAAKRLELLRELLSTATVVAYLSNPNSPEDQSETTNVQEAARALGLTLHVLHASSERDIDTAFASLGPLHAAALLMAADPYLGSRRDQVTALASRHALPLVGTTRDYVAAGALLSYGTSIPGAYLQAGVYTGRILSGAKPADLPVVQPTRFELVINLKTANSLGLQIPAKVLAIADEVIE